MKVYTRVIAGLGILMALAFAALGYQLSVIHQMQSINLDLSAINFHAGSTGLNLKQLSQTIREFSLKYFVVGDPVYERNLEGWRRDFAEKLAELQKTVRSEREHADVHRLSRAVDDYWQVFGRAKAQSKPGEMQNLPPDVSIAMERLETQTDAVYDAIQVSIQDEVSRAAEAGRKAEMASWAAGGLTMGLGIFIMVMLVRTINEPLRQLTKGTHAIAKGQFWHRLPAHGRDEFSDLARDFNAMAVRLAELDEMKKGFVSHVSHDLKAPLASMRQVMHLLLQEIPGSLNQQQKELLSLSYNSAERLAAMVGNLLDVSRMEAGTMEYEMGAHDLIPIIKSVIEEFDLQAQEKGIRLTLDSPDRPVVVACDRDRILQVIGNLLENALKFSPSNGKIVTSIVERNGGSIRISVTDSGTGIPDAQKERVFHKFHQVKLGKKMAGQGVGLGLAICKTIVEAHQGEIWVEDNPNGGSVFSFILHAAAKEEAVKCVQPA